MRFRLHPALSAAGAQPAVPPTGAQRRCRIAFIGLLLSVTLLQRFGLRFTSAFPLAASFVAIYVYLLVIWIHGNLTMSRTRLLLYSAGITVGILSWYVNSLGLANRSTATSLVLLAVLYVPHLFVQRTATLAEDDVGWVLQRFADLTFLCACAGIAQFYAQRFIHAEWLFDFTHLLPRFLQGVEDFNTAYNVGWAYKSNGFFFLEPSHFSVYMALGLIAELNLTRRFWRLAGYGLALLLSYSGSGIVVLGFAMLFPLSLKTAIRVLGLAVIAGIILYALGEVLNLTFIVDRLHNFTSERTSAYSRYIGPWRLIGDGMHRHAWSLVLGHGPGTMAREIQTYVFHTSTWAKLIFEYGLLGFFAMLGLFVSVTCRRGIPPALQGALVISWLVVDSNLLSPQNNYAALALAGLLTPSAARTLKRSRGPRTASFHHGAPARV